MQCDTMQNIMFKWSPLVDINESAEFNNSLARKTRANFWSKNGSNITVARMVARN